mgnify:CR=1 FL=1
MQFSTRLPVAVHILLCIDVFEGQYKTTSTFLADSVGVNPVIVRNTLGQLKTAGLVRVEAARRLRRTRKTSLCWMYSAQLKKRSHYFTFTKTLIRIAQ